MNNVKNKKERKELNKEVKKYRDQIKNEYYGRKHLQLIWLARHVMRKKNSALHIITHRLISQNICRLHLKNWKIILNSTSLQETYLLNQRLNIFHIILPPENVIINESLPDEEEIELVIKKQKDNKCQGTYKIYAEHLKYANSDRLVSAVLLLFYNDMDNGEGTWNPAIIRHHMPS